jgi:hypothetical protein
MYVKIHILKIFTIFTTDSQNKQLLFSYRALTSFGYLREPQCVLFKVGTELVYLIYMNFRLQLQR